MASINGQRYSPTYKFRPIPGLIFSKLTINSAQTLFCV